MRSAITISLVPEARGGPFVFTDGLDAGCRAAAELGFDAVEIFAPAAAAIDRATLRGLLARHGLSVAAFGTGSWDGNARPGPIRPALPRPGPDRVRR